MNKQELTNIIRTIVREEVERSLPNVLVEILASKVAEGQEVVTERRVAQAPVRKPVAPVPQRKFSTNPVLNQILNETQGGVPSDPDAEMVSAEMPVPGQRVSILDTLRAIPKHQLAESENKEVAGVLNVLNRDFRQVVKAVDRKASSIVPPPNFKMTPGQFDQE